MCQNFQCVWCSTKYKVTVQVIYQLSRQAYSEYCQTFKMKRFTKKIMWRCATKYFQGSGGFVELGHFDKPFVKTSKPQEEMVLPGKHIGGFSPRYS